MLEYVFGDPRAGKTSYVVARVLNEYLYYMNDNYFDAIDYIRSYNARHDLKLSTPPQKHVVFSDFEIKRDIPLMTSYPMSGFEFGKPNTFQPTKRLMPHGVYVFDEISRYWPSKTNFTLPPWVTEAFELRGHLMLDIFLISQKFVKLHSDIRDIVDIYTLVEYSMHTYKIGKKTIKSRTFLNNGVLTKTEFFGRKFTTSSEVEQYLRGEKVGQPFKYEYIGNIRACYNPYAFASDLEETNTDFEYEEIYQSKRPREWDNYKKLLKKQEEAYEKNERV